MSPTPIKCIRPAIEPAKTPAYSSDLAVEETLCEVNARLESLERASSLQCPALPAPQLVFIVYVPRSGSTVLSQLLARTGSFNYISNFQARFWLAPYVGGIVEKTLGPRDCPAVPLRSRHGLTQTASSPSEFSYFWKHWLKLDNQGVHTLDDQGWGDVDLAGLRRELQLLGSLRDGPLFFKKEWLGMNAGYFLEAFPSLKILHIRRNLTDVACSIADARRAVYGAVEHWWAARPACYAKLRDLPWPEQIAGQIHGILADTARWEALYPDRFLAVDYESLAVDVGQTFHRVSEFLHLDLPVDRLPRCLARTRSRQTADVDKLERALADWGLVT